MSDKPRLTPAEALDRLFEVIRDEALSNPNFARRMLTAVGCQVVFTGGDAASSADPILVAAGGNFTAFHETFMSFSEKDLKTFITNFGLATAEDVKTIKGKNKKPGFVQLMWDGAQRKITERRPH
jgi:hypothetical protein